MIGLNETHRHRLIITADDFGVSPRANRNILYLISLGKIDRVSVMVHGKISDKEIRTLVHSGVKIDIHLDILHKFHKNRKGRQGVIRRISEFIKDIATGKISNKKVALEWEDQIKKFQDLFGKNPDGINSHEHVHLFPPFFKIVILLQQKHSIPYIRFGDSIFLRHHNIVSHILHYLRKINLMLFRGYEHISSGSLISLDWISDVDGFLENLPQGKIEIACHPELAEDFEKIRKYF